MKSATATPMSDQDEIRMGSEYASARDYLARRPRVATVKPSPRKTEPQHGSNDSDFGFVDQHAE